LRGARGGAWARHRTRVAAHAPAGRDVSVAERSAAPSRLHDRDELEQLRVRGARGAELRPEVARARAVPGATAKAAGRAARARGWRVRDAARLCPDPERYRRYIQRSKGEWSVAKNGYVTGRAGWFSERSACYLAAGRPVIVQDTGFAEDLRRGAGIVPFCTPDETVEAVREVERDYARLAADARESEQE